MTNEAIHIDHTKPLLATTNDSHFYEKREGAWYPIIANLYKSEFNEIPSNDLGEVGDYYAKYFRRYNYIQYSEDFTKKILDPITKKEVDVWNKSKINLVQEPMLWFPEDANPYKMRASTDNSKHFMYHMFHCTKNAPHTFSIFVKSNDFYRIKISLGNATDEDGISNTVNLLNGTFNIETYGNPNRCQNYSGTCSMYDDSNDVYRISVSGIILDTINIRVSVKLLDNNGNEVFQPLDDKKGLFINGAQLSKNSTLENYLSSDSKYATSLSFTNLWKKMSPDSSHPISSYPTGYWKEIPNYLHQLSEEPSIELGENGDIATIDAILTLKPFVIFGNAKESITVPDKTSSNSVIIKDKETNPTIKSHTITLTKGIKDRGTLFYSKKNDAWYIRTKKGNCRLMLKTPAPNYYDTAMAMTLGQQTYMTYNRGAKFVFRHGRNLAGNMNNIRTKSWI